VLNMTTAKALGLDVPTSILLSADEPIDGGIGLSKLKAVRKGQGIEYGPPFPWTKLRATRNRGAHCHAAWHHGLARKATNGQT
jgi:hypothetical protein